MKKSLLALASFIALAGSASALTLQESYQLALKNDLEYARAGSALSTTLAKANGAYSAVLPSIGFTYNWALQRDLSLPSQFQNQLSTVNIALQQNLFDLGAFLKLNIALKEKRQAETTYYTARQDLINRVVAGYLKVMKENSALEVAQKQVNYLDDVFKATQIKYRKGLASAVDSDLAQAKLAQAQSQVYGAQAKLSKAINDFKVMVGESADISTMYSLSKLPTLTYPTNVQQAMASNLTLKSLAMTVQMAKLGTEVGIAALFPTITLQGRISNSPKNNTQIGEKDWKVAHELDKLYIGVNLTVPIFTGGKIYNGIKQANGAFSQAQISYNLAYKQLASGFNTNLLAIKANQQIVKTYDLSYKASKKAYDAKKAAYNAGLASVTEFVDVANQLYSAQAGLNNARYDYVSSVIQQKLLAGTLNEEDLKNLDRYLSVPEQISAKVN